MFFGVKARWTLFEPALLQPMPLGEWSKLCIAWKKYIPVSFWRWLYLHRTGGKGGSRSWIGVAAGSLNTMWAGLEIIEIPCDDGFCSTRASRSRRYYVVDPSSKRHGLITWSGCFLTYSTHQVKACDASSWCEGAQTTAKRNHHSGAVDSRETNGVVFLQVLQPVVSYVPHTLFSKPLAIALHVEKSWNMRLWIMWNIAIMYEIVPHEWFV